jgi:REP element-mobilizing transposase RayT
MRCNYVGEVVADCLSAIPQHEPSVTLDAFVVMPNHLHGIVVLGEGRAGQVRPLPVIIGSFKAAAGRRLGFAVWQRSYWDRIIRSEREWNELRHYIDDNPARWAAARPSGSW